MNKKIAATFCLLLGFILNASAADGMEEVMFHSGKIYTFLVVAFIVLLGTFFYMFRIDKRLVKMEQDIEQMVKRSKR